MSMSQENQAKLCQAFPGLYRQFASPEDLTDMTRFGLECGDGWLDLLRGLSADLDDLARTEGLTPQHPDYPVITQVKEKFGVLRVYLLHSTQAMRERIEQATQASAAVCEICGAPGTLLSPGWCRTRCDSCRAEEDELLRARLAQRAGYPG